MTHVVGWKNSRGAFISGDSAITSTADPDKAIKLDLDNQKSTFGELHVKEKNKTIQERNLKLYNILGKLIIGFAGKASTAFEVIDIIKRELDDEEAYQNTIERVLHYHRFPKNLQLIAAFMDGDTPILLSYNYDGDRKIIQHSKNVTIGNLDEIHTEASLAFTELVIENENDLSDDDALIMVNSANQGMILVENLIEHGIGGFFTGLYINENGVFWQKDTAYVTFNINEEHFFSNQQDPNLIYQDSAIIKLLIRDDRVALGSPYLQRGHQQQVYKNYLRRTAASEERSFELRSDIAWYQKWRDEVTEKFTNLTFDYYCFLCKYPELPLRITFVSKESNEIETWFDLERISDDGECIITPRGEFVNHIKPRESKAVVNFHWCIPSTPHN